MSEFYLVMHSISIYLSSCHCLQCAWNQYEFYFWCSDQRDFSACSGNWTCLPHAKKGGWPRQKQFQKKKKKSIIIKELEHEKGCFIEYSRLITFLPGTALLTYFFNPSKTGDLGTLFSFWQHSAKSCSRHSNAYCRIDIKGYILLLICFMIFIIQSVIVLLLQSLKKSTLLLRDLVTQWYCFQKWKQAKIDLNMSDTKYEMLTQDLFFLLRHKNSNLETSSWPWRWEFQCIPLTSSKPFKTFLALHSWACREFQVNFQVLLNACNLWNFISFSFISSLMNFRMKKEFPKKISCFILYLHFLWSYTKYVNTDGNFSFAACRFWIWVATA